MNECRIVQDLLPLYVDELLSEESAEMVRSHTENCEACRKVLERYREPMPEEQQDPKAYKKSIRKDTINLFAKILLGALLIAGVLICLLNRLSVWYEWKHGDAPVEAVFESPDGFGKVTVVDWDESGVSWEGSGSLVWDELTVQVADEWGHGIYSSKGCIPVPWEDIQVEWAPNGYDYLIEAEHIDGYKVLFVFDTESWFNEEGGHHVEGKRYPLDYNGPGLSEILIPLCQAHPDFPTGWESVEFTFFRWSEDSEVITFVYELDNGTRGFLEYEYKTETIISVD